LTRPSLSFVSIVVGIWGLSFLWFGNTWFFAFTENWTIGGMAAINLIAYLEALNTNAFRFIATGRWLLIIPVIVGFLVFARWTRFRWLARYPVSVMSGVGVGIIVGLTIRSQMINTIVVTADELLKLKPDPVSAILMTVGVVCVLTYFLYSITFSQPFHQGRLRWAARVGRWLMLVAAGFLWSRIFITEAVDITTGIFMMWVRRTVQEVQMFLGLPSL